MAKIKLPGPRVIALRQILVGIFLSENDFEEVLQLVDQSLATVSQAAPLPTRLLQSIKHAEANDYLPELLDAAVSLRPTSTELIEFRDSLVATLPPPGVSPFDFCQLGGGTVMVDREPLRDAVEELCNPNGRRILVIRGEPQSGKSHSLQLITFISDVVGGFTVVALNLEPRTQADAPLVIDAATLATRLVKLNGYNLALPPSPGDRQWAKWAIDFCDELENCVRGTPVRWIVIDGINKVVLDQTAQELVHELANRIYSSIRNLRLVLVGYEQSLPAGVLPYIQEEKVARITDKHLIEFFARACVELNIPHTEERLIEVVGRVLTQVDMNGSDYLLKLGPVVAQEISRKLAKVGP